MAAKLALPRQRLPGPRIAGSIVEWRGSFGWIQPDGPVNHVLASRKGGRVYMAATDVQNGLIPRQGLRVDFALYTNASGIGAQQVRAAGGKAPKQQQLQQSSQVKGVVKTIQKSKFKGAKALPGKQSGGQVKALVPQPKFQAAPLKSGGKGAQAEFKASDFTLAPKAKVAPGPGKQLKIWSGAARATPAAKAGAKGSNTGIAATLFAEKAGKKVGKEAQADKAAERTPVQGDRWFTGVVTQFFGRFGWIKPDMTIHHPKVAGHKGLMYCHIDNAAPSCTEIVKGMAVKFRAYADANGLGAQEIHDKFGHVKPAAKVAAAPVASASGGKGVGGKTGQAASKVAKGGAKGASPTAVFMPAPKAAAKVLPVQKTIQKKGSSSSSASAAGKGAGKGANPKGKAKTPLLQAVKVEAGVAVAGAGKSKGKGKAATSAADASKSTGVLKGAAVKGQAGKAAGKATGKGSFSAGQQQPPMLPNWEEHWSDEHAVPYFWNRLTKESRWIRPTK